MTDLTSEEIKELWEISGEKMKLISDDEIHKIEHAVIISCTLDENVIPVTYKRIAKSQLAADKKEMKELFRELEKPCIHPDMNKYIKQGECFFCRKDLKAKYLGE